MKQNCKTPHQNEGILSKYNCQQPASLQAIWQEKTPQTVLQEYRENFHTQNTQAGSWYTQRQLGSLYSIRF